MIPLILSKQHTLSFIDYPSRRGSSIVYYVYGCGFHCPGCQNPELQDRENALSDTIIQFEQPEDFVEYLDKIDRKENRGQRLVVFQGGDPLNKVNREFILNAIRISVEKSTGLKFCIYTGFTMLGVSEIFQYQNFGLDKPDDLGNCLAAIPFVKCGEFEKDNMNQNIGKHDNKMILASKNQTIFKYNPDKIGYEPCSEAGIMDLALSD